MKTIWKYHLPSNRTDLELPKGALILTFQMQGETACVWVLVNPENEKEKRSFELFGTGHDIPETSVYIGTVQLLSLGLVFHLFETTRH